MRKWMKWIGIIFLIPIGLVLLVSILLYIPPIQNFAVKKATEYASEASGMQIGIEKIHLTFPLRLTAKGVEVINPPADTLLTLQSISVSIKPLPLLRKNVSVESLRLQDLTVNTGSFIEGMEIKGNVHRLSVSADYISPEKEEATLNSFDLSGAAITLRIDSLSQDSTASEPVKWKILLGDIDLEHIDFALQMPTDTLRLSTYIDKAHINKGMVDLGLPHYSLDKFSLSNSSIQYDGDESEPVSGLDPAHIALNELNLSIRSIAYQDKDIRADIRSFSMTERSGLTLSSLKGKIHSDSTAIEIPDLAVKTPHSEITLAATVPWSVLAEQSEGTLNAKLTALLGREDLFFIIPSLPDDFKQAFPEKSFSLSAEAKGNLSSLHIPQVKAELPGAFHINASGKAGFITDDIRRSANLTFQAGTQDMGFVMKYLPATQRAQFHIPDSIRLEGEATLRNREYQASLRLAEDKGRVQVDARYHSVSEDYTVTLKIDSLEPIHFMPQDSILWLSASVGAEGKGTDIFSPNTWADIKGRVDSVRYINTSLSDVTLDGSLKEHQAHMEINSNYPLAKVNIIADGTIQREEIQGMLIIDADSIDLYGMHLMDTTFATKFQLFAEAKTDLKEKNHVDISLGNWEIRTAEMRFRPKMLTLKARSDEDTTQVSLNTGDLGAVLTGNAGLNQMIAQFSDISREVGLQLERDSTVHIAALRPSFPNMSLSVKAGRDNPVYNILRRSYISFTDFSLQANTSPQEGLLMDASIHAFAQDTFLIDTISASIRSDSSGILYAADVIKNKYRQQTPFKAHVQGTLRYKYADAELLYTNHKNEIGLLLGIRAKKETEGYRMQLYPEKPVIAFNTFELNPENYLWFRNAKNIEADIRLTGMNNASLWFHSIDRGSGYPELYAELSQLNLDVISTGFAQLPHMKGILSADIQYAPTEETFMVVVDANIDTLVYENGRVGELMLNAVYLPLENMEHQVDVHFYRDREEVVAANALYRAGQKQNALKGNLDIFTLPMRMINPFIPDGVAELDGVINGNIAIAGTPSKPALNGFIQLDTAAVYLGMADTRLRFDNKRIEIKNSLITFNNYNIYSVGNNPFIISGHIDASNTSRMIADLRMNAANMQVLNAKKTKESLVYGKLFMNFSSTLKGPLNGLVVRGDAQLLGGTDVTYLLVESPLTVQDRMEGLVTFTSFTDTLTMQRRNRQQMPLGGIDLLMVLHIDPTVQFRVGLTPDESNYVEVEGGGDLSFQYTRQGDMVMNGRYTFSEGIVKYSLPVIPLKEFNIHSDSYVQWDGEVMNPLVNVVATERMRATVTRDGAGRRSNFDVGISVQNRLDNMQMSFIIDAIDDSESKTELASLSEDERTRWAVFMMVTGTYMGTEGSSNMNLGGALSSFLMGEINNIAGDALKTVDIDVGLDTYEGEGGTQTDLTFSFAKRFYNDQIRVSVGGKVSTGNTAQQTQSFLDNFAAEYLLDPAGSRTVKIFYDRNYENLLEGEVVETGIGLVLRKKVLHLRELFDFRRKKVKPVMEDKNETNEQQVSNDE